MTSLALGILLELHEHKCIEGTEKLALTLKTTKSRVLAEAAFLAKYGMITIEKPLKGGGRNNRTIYRDKGVISVTNAGTRRP